MQFSEEQYELEVGDCAVTVTEAGGRLRSLTFEGRLPITSFSVEEFRLLFRAVLTPWSNRIADGRYSFAGREHELALACRIWPPQGYPFLLDLRLGYSLGPDRLTIALEATNSGDFAAPYGCSIHPYLVACGGRVDDWWLR